MRVVRQRTRVGEFVYSIEREECVRGSGMN